MLSPYWSLVMSIRHFVAFSDVLPFRSQFLFYLLGILLFVLLLSVVRFHPISKFPFSPMCLLRSAIVYSIPVYDSYQTVKMSLHCFSSKILVLQTVLLFSFLVLLDRDCQNNFNLTETGDWRISARSSHIKNIWNFGIILGRSIIFNYS